MKITVPASDALPHLLSSLAFAVWPRLYAAGSQYNALH